MKRLRLLAVSMIVAAVGLLIYCGSFYIKSYMENRAAKESYEALAYLARASEGEWEYASDQEDQSDTDQKNMESAHQKKTDQNNAAVHAGTAAKDTDHTDTIRESFGISWENLRSINPDVVAWITIPGADISYPVVQGSDDEFYLQHNFSGEKDLFGSIFLGCAHKKDMTDVHSFLYGHNMEGNMMFANLNRYEQPEFLQKCPEIEIITPERKFFYKIFSVEQAAPQSAAFIYGYELSTPAYKRQLKTLKDNSMYVTNVEPDDSRSMVTLITCNSRLDKEIRMAVHGICYLVDRYDSV